MPDPANAVQLAIRSRLIGSAAVTALVPADSILDTNQRPAPDPSIILGEDQVVDPGTLIDRSVSRIHSTLHVWKKEAGLGETKAIAGAVRAAIRASRLTLEVGFECVDCRVVNSIAMRDPDGEHGHAVVSIETLVREVA